MPDQSDSDEERQGGKGFWKGRARKVKCILRARADRTRCVVEAGKKQKTYIPSGRALNDDEKCEREQAVSHETGETPANGFSGQKGTEGKESEPLGQKRSKKTSTSGCPGREKFRKAQTGTKANLPNGATKKEYEEKDEGKREQQEGKTIVPSVVPKTETTTNNGSDGHLITIVDENSNAWMFHREYIIDIVSEQLKSHVDLTAMSATGHNVDGFQREIQLTDHVWNTYLTWGPNNKWLIDTWETRKKRLTKLKHLEHTLPDFRINCYAFIRDLNTMDKDRAAARRINETGHRFFLGEPYFHPLLAQHLLTLPTHGGSLGNILASVEKKRALEGVACARHDFSPVFESALMCLWVKGEKRAVLQRI